METYKVSVERSFYQTSYINVTAKDPDTAIEKIQTQINKGELEDSDVDWMGAEKIYEPGSFMTTGDVD